MNAADQMVVAVPELKVRYEIVLEDFIRMPNGRAAKGIGGLEVQLLSDGNMV